MKKAVFGIIGTGGIAKNHHLVDMVRSEWIELKTACDLNEQLLNEQAAKWGIPNKTTSHKELLADPEIDAVVIATKEASHVPLSVEALNAGKHVYVEKPLAEDEETCKLVVDTQEKSGKLLAMGFNRRFAPAFIKAKEILWANGGPHQMHYRMADSYWLRSTPVKPDGHKQGFRQILEECHIVDILRWFAESEVVSVYTVSSRPDEDITILKFASGAIASINGSGYVRKDFPKEYFQAIPDFGSVTIDDFAELNVYGIDNYDLTYNFAGEAHPNYQSLSKYMIELGGADVMRNMRRAGRLVESRLEMLAGKQEDTTEFYDLKLASQNNPDWNYFVDKGWQGAMDHFAKCILGIEAPRMAGALDGLISARIISAAMESKQTGKVVEI